MIVRVWGIVNDTEVEFTPIRDRPGYWEGTAPKSTGEFEDVEIWAENDKGARGHLQCSVQIKHTETHAYLLVLPYTVCVVKRTIAKLLPERTITNYQRCRGVM